jgi:aerobic C4-dicarboxylate transport protein
MSSTPPSTTAPGRPRRSRFRKLIGELWFQVLVAAVLGIAVGMLFPAVGSTFKPLNDWFVELVEMIVIPVVFCVVTTGIASMDDLRKAGRIGVKAIGYFLVLSLLSMLIGLLVANVFQPGAGMNVDPAALDADSVPTVASEQHATVTGFVSSLIPDSLFGAISGDNILAALLVSVVFGVALNMAGPAATPLTTAISALSGAVFRIVGWVMRLAPIGTFGALATVVATYGASSLQQLGYLILLFTGTCVLYVIVVLGAIMRACRLSLFGLMRFLKAELLVALSTCSSEAVLPQVVRKLEMMGVGRPVVGIVIPSGFSFNLDGSAIYLTMASLFLSQALDIDLSWQQQLVMVGVMMLTSKGTAHRRRRVHRPGQHDHRRRAHAARRARADRRRRPDPQRGPRVHQRPRQRRRHRRHRPMGEGLRRGQGRAGSACRTGGARADRGRVRRRRACSRRPVGRCTGRRGRSGRAVEPLRGGSAVRSMIVRRRPWSAR